MKLFEKIKLKKNKNILEGLDDYIRKHFIWPDASGSAKEEPVGMAMSAPMDEGSMDAELAAAAKNAAMGAAEYYNSCAPSSLLADIDLITDDDVACTEAAKPGEKKAPKRKLEDIVLHVSDTWQESLLHIIDEKGLKDSAVYKKAGIDRKLFSKIRSNKDYQPKKVTAVALALALELNLDETKDMLSRAGYALSPSSVSDLIIEYFIMNGVHDIYTINMALYSHNQPVLGE